MSVCSGYSPVNTKTNFVRRFMRDEFGNRGYNWDDIQQFEAARQQGFTGAAHIRCRRPWGPTAYDVPARDVQATYRRLLRSSGTRPGDWYFAAMAPTPKTVLQGEIQDQPGRGLVLTYTRTALPMRAALADQSLTACGIMSRSLLRTAMDPTSYDWLWILLERYPEHVIEFSTYSVPWGVWPHLNTVFWEVRNY